VRAQASFDFGAPASLLPGLLFVPDFITLSEEADLLESIAALSFRTFSMHGVQANRRIADFGYHYSFGSRGVHPGEPFPQWLIPIVRRAADAAHIAEGKFAEALITEYQPGAGIGWHRDAPPFGIVAGISLASDCVMKFRERQNPDNRRSLELARRSFYLLTDESRTDWEHMIPPARELRYSITLRTLRD
jgi:alkylated DNA repair dioxygenase AlkB